MSNMVPASLHNRMISRLADLKQKWRLVAAVFGNQLLSLEANNPHNGRHAERRAIDAAGKNNCAGATLYVLRMSSVGLGMAKPCHACANYAKEAGIKKVVYSTSSGIEEYRL